MARLVAPGAYHEVAQLLEQPTVPLSSSLASWGLWGTGGKGYPAGAGTRVRDIFSSAHDMKECVARLVREAGPAVCSTDQWPSSAPSDAPEEVEGVKDKGGKDKGRKDKGGKDKGGKDKRGKDKEGKDEGGKEEGKDQTHSGPEMGRKFLGNFLEAHPADGITASIQRMLGTVQKNHQMKVRFKCHPVAPSDAHWPQESAPHPHSHPLALAHCLGRTDPSSVGPSEAEMGPEEEGEDQKDGVESALQQGNEVGSAVVTVHVFNDSVFRKYKGLMR